MAAVLAGGHSREIYTSQCSTDMQEKSGFENDLRSRVERATDFLLLRDFEKCAFECNQGLVVAKQQANEESVQRATETFCVLWIQAYAELDRWREVLPFITQEYQGIEGCPAKVVLLLVLLHAKVEEFAQCHAIASIWLKTEENAKNVEGYSVLVEAYLTNVLARQRKWPEMGTFLKSCSSLPSEAATRLIQLSEHLKATEEANIIRKEREEKALIQKQKKLGGGSHQRTNSQKKSSAEEDSRSVNNHDTHRRIVTFVHGIGLYISRGFSYINLQVIYKIIFVGMCVYLITVQGNMGDMITSTRRVGTIGEALKKLISSLLWPRHQH